MMWRAIMRLLPQSAACLVVCVAALTAAPFNSPSIAGQGQIQAIQIQAPVVVVNFSELARQEALRARVGGEAVPYLVPEPHEFEEPATPIRGEPPNPAAIVDVFPGPSI